jgi:hypothetical protein
MRRRAERPRRPAAGGFDAAPVRSARWARPVWWVRPLRSTRSARSARSAPLPRSRPSVPIQAPPWREVPLCAERTPPRSPLTPTTATAPLPTARRPAAPHSRPPRPAPRPRPAARCDRAGRLVRFVCLVRLVRPIPVDGRPPPSRAHPLRSAPAPSAPTPRGPSSRPSPPAPNVRGNAAIDGGLCPDRGQKLSLRPAPGTTPMAVPQVRRPLAASAAPRRMGQTTAPGEEVSA